MWQKFSEIASRLHEDCRILEFAENGLDKEKTTASSAVISSWQGTPLLNSVIREVLEDLPGMSTGTPVT